ncbi:MAG: DUF1622 domain-containing protein [Oscillospiraceae bacterium]
MLEEIMNGVLPHIITLIELIGILVVTVGCFKAFAEYVQYSIMHKDILVVRHHLGESMVTGLEFKMAAEILRTVLVRDFKEILMLGGIIILRALLAFLIKNDIKDEEKRSNNFNN